MSSDNNLEKFVYDWNIKFPIDRWWRLKHKIPFNSRVHRESSFIDMYFEFLEDKMWDKFLKKVETDYVPGSGDFLIKREMTQKEIDDLFDKIDITKI